MIDLLIAVYLAIAAVYFTAHLVLAPKLVVRTFIAVLRKEELEMC
ncbi:hypothetical protein [Thermococcus sp.]|nr:hypothetical protein [Thermococcus sp.]